MTRNRVGGSDDDNLYLFIFFHRRRYRAGRNGVVTHAGFITDNSVSARTPQDSPSQFVENLPSTRVTIKIRTHTV